MRGASMGLIGLGVLIVLVGVINHWVLKMNPVAHTSTIMGVVGAVLAVIGVAMMVMGGRASTAR